MSNVLLYPDSDTLFEQLHSLGYTKQPPENVTVYNSDNEQTVIIKDTSDNTIYDSENLTWVNDIDDLNLYNKISITTMYIGSDPIQCDGFSNSLYNETITYILYNDVIESIELLHNSIGLTDHPCVLYEVDSGEASVWYDPENELYWDAASNEWVEDPPPVTHDVPNMYIAGPKTFAKVYNFEQDDGSVQSGQFEGGSFTVFGTNKSENAEAIQRAHIIINT